MLSTIMTNRRLTMLTFGILALSAVNRTGHAQSTAPQSTAASSAQTQTTQPYVVEWVYRVKWGHQDEFWQIFKKYQIAILNKEKEAGGVLKYEVFRPGLHTSNDQRWDYRVIIYYKDSTSSSKASAISKQLFPDQATLKREEQQRWELTENHWDLPIRQIDPNAAAAE
jgi:hypothetical protein